VRASRPHFFDVCGIVQAGRLHHKHSTLCGTAVPADERAEAA
jgi:hypothetical protein